MGVDGCFGQTVRNRRRALDLTQESLAQRVGCSVVTIRKVESDERRPSRQLAERLAACLEIAPAEQPGFLLLARAEPGTPPAPSPAPSPAERPPNNLSSPLTRLIGRQDAALAVCGLLRRETRLVTLVGPPGIGKSRLAIQAASDLLAHFPEG
ncbi:MAG TPA: helix-turn-helix domain-containing protein, partial [Herpetosiphonaceae bacterium]|nr:helix-turn-helix domain-containing protein [Herpetosiphonaceae bacterium]